MEVLSFYYLCRQKLKIMTDSNLWLTFLSNLQQTSFLEFIAVITGLMSVWFARKENIWVYPTGIISVLIYVKVCFGARLYADMGINVIYFLMSVYGWYNWTRKDNEDHFTPITRCSHKERIRDAIITAMMFGVLSIVISKFTDSDVPFLDSFTTSIFITGMWLMAKKRLENWVYWTIANFVSVPLYFYKGLVFSSFQFTVFLYLAVMGYIEWRRKLAEMEMNQVES